MGYCYELIERVFRHWYSVHDVLNDIWDTYARVVYARPPMEDPMAMALADLVNTFMYNERFNDAILLAAKGCIADAVYSKAPWRLIRNYEMAKVCLGLGDCPRMTEAPLGIVYREPGSDEFRSEFILYPVVLPWAGMLWDRLFPDHCRGYEVFFAGLARRVAEGPRGFYIHYVPFLAVSCSHWEHGSVAGLGELQEMLEEVAFEAFKGRTLGLEVHGTIVVYDPSGERLLAVLYMPDEDGYEFRTPRQALKRFSPTVRAQLGFVPDSLVSERLGVVMSGSL